MQAGEKLIHYEIIAKIGAGGMGEVYRARDTKLGREVALKILPDEFMADEERHQRFHREAKLLAAFTHPNVAAIHSLEEDAGHHFLVLELVEGEDLAARIGGKPLPVAAALDIARQIAVALAAAHEMGIIHRDLKPQNVMVGDSGGDRDQTKILDFGLAKVYTDDFDDASTTVALDSPTATPPATRAGAIMGTSAYMSPEQVRGRPVDKRSDIWAFGCVLYEMLTGRQAFAGETVSDIMAAVLRSEPEWAELPPDLSPTIKHLLHRCLQKDRRQRLHDITDARLEIEDALAGDIDAAWGGDAQPEPTTLARSRRPSVGILLAVFGWLAAVALAVAFVTRSDEFHVPARLQTLTYSGRDWSPSVSPDGDMIAFSTDRDGLPAIWLKQINGGGEAPLTAGPDLNARFSPDGSQVLFVRDEGVNHNLYRIAVVGGHQRKLIDDVIEADWSPDGSQVAFLRMMPVDKDNLTVVGIADVQTGGEREIVRIENRLCYGLRWSPDGAWLSLIEASLSGNVAETSYFDLIAIDSGEVQHLNLIGWSGPYTSAVWAPSGQSLVVGQAQDMLAHVSGEPAQIMEYELSSGKHRPLFWASLPSPRGGWAFTTLNVMDGDRLVFDVQHTYAELREFPLHDGDGGGESRPTTGTFRVLTSGLGRDRQPVYSPDGRQVIFSSNRSGNIDLWTVDRQTGALQQVTDDPADDWDPAYTPDGRNILWSSNRSGNMEIWLAAVDGSHARQISHDGVDAENPTMTRDGQWIVYYSSNDAKLGVWKIRSDGSDATLLAGGSYLLPEVSPDGRHALFSRSQGLGYGILVIEVESGQTIPFEIDLVGIEQHVNIVPGRARWLPDGSAIVFIAIDRQGRAGVYAQDFAPGEDTAATRRKLVGFTHEYVTESLGISPSGESIVVSAMFDRRSLMLAENVSLRMWR